MARATFNLGLLWLGSLALHLFYCDETNLEERAGDFLIYGGLVIDGAMNRPGSVGDHQLK